MRFAVAFTVAAVGLGAVAWFGLRESERGAAAQPVSEGASAESGSFAAGPANLASPDPCDETSDDSQRSFVALANRFAAQPANAPGILIFGVVYSAAATGELLDSPSVTLVDRRAERSSGSITPDGGYSFSGVAPGRYWIQASATGLDMAERVLELDGSAA